MSFLRKNEIKHAQKESFIRRELAQYFMMLAQDHPELRSMYVTRVTLSPKKGGCHIYFYSEMGKEVYESGLKTLLLFKASLRSSLAKAMASRYVPELFFAYDVDQDKQRRIEALIDEVRDQAKD